MVWFNLAPVADDSIFATAPHAYSYTLDLAAPADDVWAGLVADRPLAWCRTLSGRYTSPRPFGVGTTRAVTVMGLLKLRERFFIWDDANRRHAFYVEQANVPVFRRFAEDYQVTPTRSGCRFTWRFAFEARTGIGLPFALAQPVNKTLILDGFMRDTRKRFGQPQR